MKYTLLLYNHLEITDGNNTRHYYEEDLHRPYWKAASTSVPSPSGMYASYNNATPRKGRELSEIEIPEDYQNFTVFGPRDTPHFAELVISVSQSEELHVFGWIDGFSPIASKSPRSNTLMKWHVDYWLTYTIYEWYKANRAASTPQYKTWGFGSGRLIRGPEVYKRPCGIEPRLWLVDSAEDMFSVLPDPWAVIVCTATVGDQTNLVHYYFHIGAPAPAGCSMSQPDWDDIYLGLLEEELGLDPETILGAWLCPFAPWTGGTAQDMTSRSVYYNAFLTNVNTVTKNFDDPIITDDTHRLLFADPSGAEMYKAPWGLSIKRIFSWLDVGTNAANLCVYLSETTSPPNEIKGAEGRYFTFPLPALPITENAWSSYVYSGQRDYDIQSKMLQRKEAAVTGLANAGNAAIGGAVAGSMVAPVAGTVTGALIGLSTATAGSAINYYVGQKYDSKNQAAVDKLVSNQTAGMIISAGSYAGLNPQAGYPGGWSLITLRPDAVSRAEIENDASELGYRTDIYVPSCGTVIALGGGFKIEGLKITGGMPNEGKKSISDLFERGVHLDLIQ